MFSYASGLWRWIWNASERGEAAGSGVRDGVGWGGVGLGGAVRFTLHAYRTDANTLFSGMERVEQVVGCARAERCGAYPSQDSFLPGE